MPKYGTMIFGWGTSKVRIVIVLYSADNWYCRLRSLILSFQSTIWWEDVVFEGYRLICMIERTKHIENHTCFLSAILFIATSLLFATKAYFGKVIVFFPVVTLATECFAMLLPVFYRISSLAGCFSIICTGWALCTFWVFFALLVVAGAMGFICTQQGGLRSFSWFFCLN